MYDKLYNSMAKAYVAIGDAKAMVRKLERGDADSSGSTMRTAGVVALVLAIFGFVAGAVYILAEATGGQVDTPPLQ